MSDTKTQQSADTSGSAARKLIKTTRQATKQKFTAEEQIRVAMEGIRGDDPVTVLCRGKESMSPSTTSGSKTSWKPARLG